MTFQEAIATGLPLTRNTTFWMKDKGAYITHTGFNGLIAYIDPEFLVKYVSLTIEDVLANDWEVRYPDHHIVMEDVE